MKNDEASVAEKRLNTIIGVITDDISSLLSLEVFLDREGKVKECVDFGNKVYKIIKSRLTAQIIRDSMSVDSGVVEAVKSFIADLKDARQRLLNGNEAPWVTYEFVIDELEARLKKALTAKPCRCQEYRELLKQWLHKFQWVGGICPECGGQSKYGHARDCKLVTALSGEGGDDETI